MAGSGYAYCRTTTRYEVDESFENVIIFIFISSLEQNIYRIRATLHLHLHLHPLPPAPHTWKLNIQRREIDLLFSLLLSNYTRINGMQIYLYNYVYLCVGRRIFFPQKFRVLACEDLPSAGGIYIFSRI